MIRKAGFATLAIVGCVTAARAADNRIRTQAYNANRSSKSWQGRDPVDDRVANDERIENVAVGDLGVADHSQPPGEPALREAAERAQPDQHDGRDRPAHLHVRPRSGEKSAAPVYALKFSYPNEKPRELAVAAGPAGVGSTAAGRHA